MPEKCLIPCAIDEEIRVDITNENLGHRTFLFNFPVKICQAGDEEREDVDVWIDTSGSLSSEKVNILKELAVGQGFRPIEDRNERWIQWALVSALAGRSCYMFINESSPYNGSSAMMYQDLASFGDSVSGFPKPIFIELIIITDNLESPELIASANTAFFSGVFDKIIARKREIAEPNPDIFKELLKEKENFIEIKRINGWARKYIDFLRKIAPLNPLYNLLDEGLFDIEIFSYKSRKKIEVSIKCGEGNNCPDGYCEIPSDEYPFYCCVKF